MSKFIRINDETVVNLNNIVLARLKTDTSILIETISGHSVEMNGFKTKEDAKRYLSLFVESD